MTEQRTASYRVAVVGGGVIGLCSAFYLQRRGHQVTVFDQSTVGSGASRGNGGQIVTADPLPAPGMVREGLRHWFSPSSAFYIHPQSLPVLSSFLVRFALNANARTYMSAFNKLDQLNRVRTQLFDELASEGIGDHFEPTGNLRAFESRETALSDWQAARRLAALGLAQQPGEFLDTADLHALEPSLGAAARWGFLRPDVRFGDPSRFVDQLSRYLTEHGVKIVEHAGVTDITERAGSVTVLHGGDETSVDRALIAAGLGSTDLLRGLGCRIRMVPGKGYSFTVEPAQMPRYTILLGEAHVGATPLDDVRLRIAGTMELGGSSNGSIAQDRIKAITTAAAPFLDGVDWSSVTEQWVGSRPMTPDGLPYIGRVGRSERVFAATGHNMLGLSLAPATGQAIAGLISGDGDDATLAAFALSR